MHSCEEIEQDLQTTVDALGESHADCARLTEENKTLLEMNFNQAKTIVRLREALQTFSIPSGVGEPVKMMNDPRMFDVLCKAHDLSLDGKHAEARELMRSVIDAVEQARIPDNY